MLIRTPLAELEFYATGKPVARAQLLSPCTGRGVFAFLCRDDLASPRRNTASSSSRVAMPIMPDHSTDEQFLHRALDLARQGIGLASPNPYVGAVIVDAQGSIVGTGAYTYDGVKHAEVRALEQAGDKARGGTLYINLEPHSHQGRTPPCTDALIAAGIRRVVASMPDPNPKVSGQGFEKLRAAGVHCGSWTAGSGSPPTERGLRTLHSPRRSPGDAEVCDDA